MATSAAVDTAGFRKVKPRKQKRSPASERRAAKRAMQQAQRHAAEQAKLARERVDHLAAGELNPATAAATDLKVAYEQHRRGKADAANQVVKNFEGIERTQVLKPSETMRVENLKQRPIRLHRLRGGN